MIAPVKFDLNESFDLVNDVSLREQVARVDELEQEVSDALLINGRVNSQSCRLQVRIVVSFTVHGAYKSASFFIRSFARLTIYSDSIFVLHANVGNPC